jgi:glyoxylase-like metal-dependent hydrolase (beta-lactamase superfamily II)
VKPIPLEDNFNDVLGKAQRGLKLSDEALAQKSGVSVAELTAIKGGQFDATLVRRLAGPLELDAETLVELGQKTWYPQSLGEVPGLACFNTTYEDMTVNSYLAWDPKSDNGVCFDTGADSAGMLQLAAEKKLRVQSVLLTHTHVDHIADLGRLTRATGAKAFVSRKEAIDGAESFEAGHKFVVGSLQIETRHTSGHSSGGITYVIHGLPRRVAIVGDALFAASMGGGAVSYQDALRNNREQIFTLPDDTILCPGHGPLTTVGEEKTHNSFYPQYKKVAGKKA